MKSSMASAINNSDLIQQVMPFWFTLKSQNSIVDLYTPANPNVPMAVPKPISTTTSSPTNAPVNPTPGVVTPPPLQLLHSAGFKILPTITDGTYRDPKTGKATSMVLSNLLAEPKSRANIIKTIMNLVMNKDNNFDGIDLDFENFAFVDPISTWPTTQLRWVQFIIEISSALHAQGKLLSITTPPLFDPASGKKGYYQYAWSDVGQYIDQLHIMAYDYSTSRPGPIGPIQWTTSAVKYAISVMPASKVYIGIPGYGRDWVTSVSGTCPTQPINYLKTVAPGVASTFVMRDAVGLAATYGAKPTYDTATAESTFTYQKVYNGTTSNGSLTTCTATRKVWYQDFQSYTARANLVGKYRLGGITEWTLGMEDPTATAAIRKIAQLIAPDLVNAQITSDMTAVAMGTPVTITGKFSLPDKSPIAGLSVHLQTQVADGAPINLSDGFTASDGSYSVTFTANENTKVTMTSDGSWERIPMTTAPLSISVTRSLSWTAPVTMKRGVTYRITGQIQPSAPGVLVSLNNGASAITDGDGNFTFEVTNALPGFVKYVATVSMDKHFAKSQSSILAVWVR